MTLTLPNKADKKIDNKLFNLTPEERKYFENKAKELDAQKSLYDDIMKAFSEKQPKNNN